MNGHQELEVAKDASTHPLAGAVLEGLRAHPKRLPAALFYDARGSALFERITALPEYYLTRAELSILRAHAAQIAAALPGPRSIIELGAGTAAKTGVLLDALIARQGRVTYYPIDVSGSALAVAARALARPRLTIEPLVGLYEEFFDQLPRLPGPRLVLFIGSSIGNYEPQDAVALLSRVRATLSGGDALLLGADLRKDPRLLLPAYDDAQGVTAAFNKNALVQLNRVFGGDFDPERFRHVAVWNERCSRIEMHLESLVEQAVPLRGLGLWVHLEEGERIHTENSYKLPLEAQLELLGRAGFEPRLRWLDDHGRFALHLAGCGRR